MVLCPTIVFFEGCAALTPLVFGLPPPLVLLPDLFWPLQSSSFPGHGIPQVAQALRHAGTALGVSDGSYMPHMDPSQATAAWTLVDSRLPNNSGRCTGQCSVSGAPDSINSYRAELQGLHCILLAVHTLCNFHLITQGHLLLFCDNMLAVTLASKSP